MVRFVQHCPARECALVRFSTFNMSASRHNGVVGGGQHVEPNNALLEHWTLDVIGHSPWGFSGPLLQISLLGEIGRQLI